MTQRTKLTAAWTELGTGPAFLQCAGEVFLTFQDAAPDVDTPAHRITQTTPFPYEAGEKIWARGRFGGESVTLTALVGGVEIAPPATVAAYWVESPSISPGAGFVGTVFDLYEGRAAGDPSPTLVGTLTLDGEEVVPIGTSWTATQSGTLVWSVSAENGAGPVIMTTSVDVAEQPLASGETPASDVAVLVAADGWQVDLALEDIPPAFVPDVTPVEISVDRNGFVGAVASSIIDVLTLTARVREPYPNEANLTPQTAALSDYIYAGDVVQGGTNNSAVTSPKPIANWADLDHTTVGDTLTAEVVAFHRDARSGEQVAGVRFTATDGTDTVTQTVTASIVSGRAGDQNAVVVYAADLDVSSLADDAAITVNAEVFPHIGTTPSVLSSADQTERREFSPRTYYRKSDGLVPLAYVDPVGGNDSTGVISTNAGTAAASPYATISGAIGTTGGLRGFGNANGAEIRLLEGTHSLTAAFGADLVMSSGALTLKPAPGATKAATIVEVGGVQFRPRINAGGGWVRVEGVTVQRKGVTASLGETGSQLELAYVDCAFDNESQNASLFGNSIHGLFIGCDFSNLASSALAPATAEIRLFRGCSGAPAGAIEGWLMLGCSWTGQTSGGFGVGVRGETGRIIAFNSFWDQQARAIQVGAAADADQVAVVQNLIEVTTSGSTSMVWVSADDADTTTRHVVIHHNTIAGSGVFGRSNLFYDQGDTSGAQVLNSVKNNIHAQINTKGDVFQTDGAFTGNWAYMYGVGVAGEWSLYMDADQAGLGSSFAQAYPGLGADISTSSAVMNDPGFLNFQATTLTADPNIAVAGVGGGDYRLQGGATAKDKVLPTLPFDLLGYQRAAQSAPGAFH